MNARDYYRQAHEIPAGIVDAVYQFPIAPHAEDSGPTGRPCFRLGTYRNRSDVVCRYPQVEGELDFWAVSYPPINATRPWIYVGEDADSMFVGAQTAQNLPLYKALKAARTFPGKETTDWTDWENDEKFKQRLYEPRVRCSRLAFVGGLGYDAGKIVLPNREHPTGEGNPTPSADKFLGWYEFDWANRDGLIHQYWEGGDPGSPVFTQEGWGRPAFDFTPIARHARQSWAYAPATPTRTYDKAPYHPDFDDNVGITTIYAGSWESKDGTRNVGVPNKNWNITNWWLLAMIGGDPQHGKNPDSNPPTPAGQVIPLYWNPEIIEELTYFGEEGTTPDLTQQLYETILYRIYRDNCKTAAIDPSFAGVQFPPGFLVDVRILAETWECRCAHLLWSDKAQYSSAGIKVFQSVEFPKPTPSHPEIVPNPDWALDYIYLGTHFSVLYRCPFPLWRKAVA